MVMLLLIFYTKGFKVESDTNGWSDAENMERKAKRHTYITYAKALKVTMKLSPCVNSYLVAG